MPKDYRLITNQESREVAKRIKDNLEEFAEGILEREERFCEPFLGIKDEDPDGNE